MADVPRPRSPSVPRWGPSLRKFFALASPVLLLVSGLGIAVASLTPNIESAYSMSFPGTLAPGSTSFPLPGVLPQFVETTLTTGGCNLRLYPATAAQWTSFNSTGVLPSAWIGCSNRSMTTAGIQYEILVNEGTAQEPYNVTAYGYSIRTPYAWLALPGTVAALAGLILFVPRIVMSQASRLGEDIARKKNK